MSGETEAKLIELIQRLVEQGEDHATADDLDQLEERIGERLEAVEGRLGSIEEAQSQSDSGGSCGVGCWRWPPLGWCGWWRVWGWIREGWRLEALAA